MIAPQWPPYLQQIWNRYQRGIGSEPDFDRRCFRILLESVSSAYPIATHVTIGGTNGKGAVAAMLETALWRSGTTTGLFVSPHLWNVTERFRINGHDVEGDDLDKAAYRVDNMVAETCATHAGVSPPTFFEVLVLTAWILFSERRVRTAIWEAGIGGGKDSVSLISAAVSALVSVSLDHTRFLGNTIAEIATEKACLAPAGIPMVLGLLEMDAEDAATAQLRRQGSPVIRPKFDVVASGVPGPNGQPFRCGDQEFVLPLLGGHQAGNIAVVRALYESLQSNSELPDFDFRHLYHTRWPGRTEWISGNPPFFIDVAHNPEAFGKIEPVIRSLWPHDNTIVLFGASWDRGHPRCDHLARELGAEIRFVEGFYRAAPTTHWITPETEGSICYLTPVQAVQHIQQSPADRAKLVVVVGSVFLAGAIRHALTTVVP